jgi:hypothetical protein
MLEQRLKTKSFAVTSFHSREPPEISLAKYVRRLQKYLAPDWASVMVLIDRVRSRITLCELTVHRLVLAATLVSDKFLNDETPYNLFYAQVGGIKLKQLNALEVEFLKLCDWNACISQQQHTRSRNLLEL